MASGKEVTGKCLCGAVRIRAVPSHRVVACHCGMCRTWGGGPLLAVDGGTDVRVEGGEHVSAFRSSDWAERAFCKRCGTHLYYRLVKTGEYEIPVGLLEEIPEWAMEEEIFVEEKPAYYTFANDTAKRTGAEAMSTYAPGAE